MNIAYGSKVISINIEFIDCRGISLNCEGSTKTPITAEIKGILNFLRSIGNLVYANLPSIILAWGTVGDIIGSKQPLVKKGQKRLLKPKLAQFIVWGDTLPEFD